MQRADSSLQVVNLMRSDDGAAPLRNPAVREQALNSSAYREKNNGAAKRGRMPRDEPVSTQTRFVQDTVESLRRIAARLPSELAREILRVAKELRKTRPR